MSDPGYLLSEGYLHVLARPVDDGTRIGGDAAGGFTDADDLLGYVPRRNVRVSARKFYKSDLIYEVTYGLLYDFEQFGKYGVAVSMAV